MRYVLAITTLLLSLSIQAKQQFEYKCWLTLPDEQQVINFYKLPIENDNLQAATLLKKRMGANREGKTAQVHECAPLLQPFIHAKAKELDAQTPR